MRMRASSWFETKIKYQKMQEDGTEKGNKDCGRK